MFQKIYTTLREIKWNLRTTFRLMPIVWNIWDFVYIHKTIGFRTARLWGGGSIYLRNYSDIQILLEIFENSYGMTTYYPTVGDIGANIGMFSVFYARRFPDAVIDAFEPEPNNFKLLLQNTAPYKNISCHNTAIGSEAGAVTLFLDKKNLGRHSVHKGWVRESGAVTVPMETLNKKYDLLKIDTEGAEYDILKTLPECQRIVMEIHEIEGESQEKLIQHLSEKFAVTDLGGHVFSCVAK